VLLVVEPKAMEDALLDVASRAGVTVRTEAFDPAVFASVQKRGGLCWVGGRAVLLVDVGLSVIERVGVLADGLSGLDVDAISMPPAVRARIEKSAKKRASAPRRPRLRRVV
jgi:hypothetical protein